MFPRPRFCLLLVVLCLCASSGAAPARAQEGAPAQGAATPRDDRVYRYRGANGREVFTNAGHVAVRGQAVTPMTLPELNQVDFDGASRKQLEQLDRSVQRAHDELQTGQRCQAIRASLRIPMRSFLWREHLRQLVVGVGLLATALVAFSFWGGRLRSLMPIAPLLGCAYLAFATFGRIDRRMDALREGLHACSSDLPTTGSSDPDSVKGRLETASSLQATVDRAYAERAAMADRIMRER
jgi:hypothetical protein